MSKKDEMNFLSYIGFKLPYKLKERLKKRAKSEERTVSNYLVRLIKKDLKSK